MKKILFTIMLGIFLINLVSSEIELDPISQNTCGELTQTCENCTFVYLTKIEFPNKTIIYPNALMTKNDVNYNYTFCTTDTTGSYAFTVKGDKDGINRTEEGILEVNPLGATLGTDKSILYGVLLLFMVGLNIFILYIIFAINLENYKNMSDEPIGISIKKYVKIILIGVLYGFILLTLNLTNVLANSLVLTEFAGIIGGIFSLMINGAWVWTLIIFIWIALTIWKDAKLIKDIKKRLEEGEWGI